MKKIATKFVPYTCISIFCMLISTTSYAGFFDDLKKEAKNIEKEIKNTTEQAIRNNNKKTKKSEKKKSAKKTTKNNNKKAKTTEDQAAAKQSEEDAQWEAAVAEEKAKKANKQVEQAEHALYQEDIDMAVKENEQAKEQARKKDAAERVPTHDHRSSDWYIAHKGVDQFKKTLDAYEVNGLSFGMTIPILEEALVSQGYTRQSRKIINGGPKYVYIRKIEKKVSSVEIRAAGFNGVPNLVIINVHNAEGETKIAEEKVRLLNAFSGTCNLIRTYAITCFKYTDTNELSISVSFIRKPNIEYRILNLPSAKAR